jgi:hypothetical protein
MLPSQIRHDANEKSSPANNGVFLPGFWFFQPLWIFLSMQQAQVRPNFKLRSDTHFTVRLLKTFLTLLFFLLHILSSLSS